MEANTSRTIRELRSQIDTLEEECAETRAKLGEATTARDTATSNLASAVVEKKKLIQEVAELKTLCEDLLVEVEKTGGK
jgi:chromosome segregation ATPase